MSKTFISNGEINIDKFNKKINKLIKDEDKEKVTRNIQNIKFYTKKLHEEFTRIIFEISKQGVIDCGGYNNFSNSVVSACMNVISTTIGFNKYSLKLSKKDFQQVKKNLHKAIEYNIQEVERLINEQFKKGE